MTIDELIAQLKQIKYEHGNVQVTVFQRTSSMMD